MSNDELQTQRPYRSHRQPACIPCRKRKSHCKVDAAQSPSCLTCSLHGTACVFPPASKKSAKSTRAAKGKQLQGVSPSLSHSYQTSHAAPTSHLDQHVDALQQTTSASRSQSPPSEPESPKETPFPNSATPHGSNDEESHIVGPVLNPDVRRIAVILNNDHTGSVNSRPVIRSLPNHHAEGAKSIMFGAVRRRPFGDIAEQTVASRKCQTVEKLVEPFRNELIKLIAVLLKYFEKVNICLRLVDETLFKQQYRSERENLSPAFLACLFAHSLLLWKWYAKRQGQYCPDIRFIWNQANEALYSELHLYPGISTIIAVLLNVSGRPVTSMIGNGVLLGSAISIAHSLGLNRDASQLDISPAERRSRTNLWWIIFIFDKWSSIAYGTPPHLTRGQYDVEIPRFTGASRSDESFTDQDMSPSFIGLITLTEILRLYLEHVYHLRRATGDSSALEDLHLQGRLIQWEHSLPSDLKHTILWGSSFMLPGSSNLRFLYLYFKFLIRKLELDTEKSHQSINPIISNSLHVPVRAAAEEVVIFVQKLDEQALSDFWLPFVAFALSSTVAFLLGCALELENDVSGLARSVSLKLAQDMITALQFHRKGFGWDLGDICLAQYSKVVEKLVTLSKESAYELPDFQQFWTFDVPSLDESLQGLWDGI
ncbi:MAG: hypothetical protein M1820_003772 [Bogoriella megaspora]|nr:MAG: hypothetical protein M1820_003772 [Bogoriella megaspora]